MTYPIDQLAGLAKANGQFLMKLADIMRSNGESCARLGTKTATEITDHFKTMTPGKAPEAKTEMAKEIVGEMEAMRDATLEKTKAAFEEWQQCWGDVWNELSDQKQFGANLDHFKTLLGSWGKAAEAVKPTAKPKAAPRAATKPADEA